MTAAPQAQMGHCKDCRWWDAQGVPRPDTTDDLDRKCLLLCLETGLVRLPLAWPVQFGMDAEYIYTDPDFGCVQWEPDE
jgi:hypothetical protein